MHIYSWHNQRLELQNLLNHELKAQIAIAPRALAALQAYAKFPVESDDDENPELMYSLDSVVEGLLKSSPAVASMLFKVGIPLESFKFERSRHEIGKPVPFLFSQLMRDANPSRTIRPTLDKSDRSAFAFAFREMSRKKHLVPTAKEVRRRRTLEEVDLLTAGIEASLAGVEHTSFGYALLTASGFPEPHGLRRHPDCPPEAYAPGDGFLRSVLQQVNALSTADPSHALLQFALYQDDSRMIRVRPFGTTGVSILDVLPPVQQGQHYIYRDGVFQSIQDIIPEAESAVLLEFEDLLNSRGLHEKDFQCFFERHPWILTALDFDRAHPQPVLYRDEGGPLIPDFFLEKIGLGWSAILDLKKPYDDMVVRRKNRTYFTQHIQNAIAQLTFYREWFESPSNRRRFADAYGVSTFRPKMIIVIGRRHHFLDDVERIRLMEGLPSRLDLITYDDLFDRAKRYLSMRNPSTL